FAAVDCLVAVRWGLDRSDAWSGAYECGQSADDARQRTATRVRALAHWAAGSGADATGRF
ncbi:MAG: hypothetical protein ACI855_001883, partial [Myxococcota bacterium]